MNLKLKIPIIALGVTMLVTPFQSFAVGQANPPTGKFSGKCEKQAFSNPQVTLRFGIDGNLIIPENEDWHKTYDPNNPGKPIDKLIDQESRTVDIGNGCYRVDMRQNIGIDGAVGEPR